MAGIPLSWDLSLSFCLLGVDVFTSFFWVFGFPPCWVFLEAVIPAGHQLEAEAHHTGHFLESLINQFPQIIPISYEILKRDFRIGSPKSAFQ